MLCNDFEFLLQLENNVECASDIFCYDILNSKDEKEAISYLRRVRLGERKFYRYLNNFALKYDKYEKVDEAITVILDIYKKYLEDYEYKMIKKSKNIDETNDKCKNLIEKIYLSGLSKEEYCFYNPKVNISDINFLYKQVGKNDITIKMIKEINSRNYDSIKYELIDIAFGILNGSYDYLDYFEHCKLMPSDFIKILSNEFSGENLTNLKKFFDVTSNDWNVENHIWDIRINFEQELQNKDIIKGIEITPDMKKEVYNYMKENNMPMISKLYKYAIRKKVNSILEENQKVKTKN